MQKYVLVILLAAAVCAACASSSATSPAAPTAAPAASPPSAKAEELANRAGMTDKAKAIFYGARPEVDSDRAVFEQNCRAPVSPNTVELGCYTSENRIYLLAITDPDLQQEMIVTASHEMLHAAYAILPADQKQAINAQLEAAVPALLNRELGAELAQYEITEPGQRDNELHSILATEYAPLPPELEAYYAAYFKDRQTVVEAAVRTKKVFSDLQEEIRSLGAQLAALKVQMNAELRRGNTSAYNALVPQYNALVARYNAAVQRQNELSRSLKGEEAPAP